MFNHISDSEKTGKWRDLNSQLLEQQFKTLSVKPFDNTPNATKKGLYSGLPCRHEADSSITHNPLFFPIDNL